MGYALFLLGLGCGGLIAALAMLWLLGGRAVERTDPPAWETGE